MFLRAELGHYFRADKPTTANDHDLHHEPFRVAFDWITSASCLPPPIEPLKSVGLPVVDPHPAQKDANGFDP